MSNLLRGLYSLKLTVAALAWLIVLVFWGTLYQVDHGLYAAQEAFYYSWFFFPLPFLPLPGGMFVMWVLFLNLFLSMMLQFKYGLRRFGITLIHIGLLLLLAGGWVTHLFGEESYLSLVEGEGSNLSSSYREWEISARRKHAMPRDVLAVDAAPRRPGAVVDFGEIGFTMELGAYFPNARPLAPEKSLVPAAPLNASGIQTLQSVKPAIKSEENLPGLTCKVTSQNGQSQDVLLFGGDRGPTTVNIDGADVHLSLRRKRYPLPVLIQLIDFKKERHPNSQIFKSFSSRINVFAHDAKSEALIEMNEPLRYQGYTFFQASFADAGQGAEISTFAVNKNYGRLIPYWATGITVVGLILHFLIELYRPREPLKNA